MKKYYLNNGQEQIGPLDLEDLRNKNISKDTPVWHEGLTEWTAAGKIDALKELFKTVPPPFNQKNTISPPVQTHSAQTEIQEPKKKGRPGLIIGIIIVLALVTGAVMITNNPNSVPGIKIEVNTPKPIVITTRSDNSKSGLLKLRTTVYATVQNQGGEGNVLVTFSVMQDGQTFDRTKSLHLIANQSQDLQVTFEEVKTLGGDITYNVETRAE